MLNRLLYNSPFVLLIFQDLQWRKLTASPDRNEKRNNVIRRNTFDIFRTRGHLNPHDAFIYISRQPRSIETPIHLSSYAIAESKLSLAPRSGVGRYFRDEVTQGPSDISPAPAWCMHLKAA